MIRAVIFDWGGTLTLPLEPVLYRADAWDAAAGHMSIERAAEIGRHLQGLEEEVWELSRSQHKSGRLADLFLSASEELKLELEETALEEAVLMHLGSVAEGVTHDPEAAGVLTELRERGLKLGLLSNTIWPEGFHEDLLERDGLKALLDARFYTSEMPVTKPHPEAFLSVLTALGESDPGEAVFVGDRPWDDIYGANKAGMRTVLRPNPMVPSHEVEPDATIGSLTELLPLIEGWNR